MKIQSPPIAAVLMAALLFALPSTASHTGKARASGLLPEHHAFTTILTDVVRGSHVSYDALGNHSSALDAYLETLGDTDPETLATATKGARLAFWLNAYNACMLDLVGSHYPIKRAGSGGLRLRIMNGIIGRPANSVWQIEDVFTRKHCRIARKPRSQDEIEHQKLRPTGEPRVHFGLSCASESCPALAPKAYTADAVDRQLDQRVRYFLADKRHFYIEREGEPVVHVNELLEWFKEDFGGMDGVREFLASYLPASDAALVRDPATRFQFIEYDWRLNDAKS